MGISLSPGLEDRIRQKVAAGVVSSVEAFVDTALRQALGLGRDDQVSHDGKTPEQLEMGVDEFFAAIDSNLPPDTPVLPNDALSRDAIYEGRG